MKKKFRTCKKCGCPKAVINCSTSAINKSQKYTIVCPKCGAVEYTTKNEN